ncbi:MAG: hypothetical protein IH881_13015 [Myxococcales bacterium]|nr:hypothetical protein [Myxococcales bacterium]
MEEILPWTGDVLSMILYGAVGLKLWYLSNRTGEFAERILGFAILCWGLSFAVYDIPYLLLAGDERFVPIISLVSFIVADFGNFAFAIFTWVVFRRGEPWALGLLVLIAAAIVLGWVGSALMGDLEFLGINGNPFHWFERTGVFLTSVWMAFEATKEGTRAQLTLRLQQQQLNQWLQGVRDRADVRDLRDRLVTQTNSPFGTS